MGFFSDIFSRSRVGTISSELDEPLRNFKYHVSVTGIVSEAGFSKVSGIEEESAVLEYREGNYKWGVTTKKSPGLVKYSPVLLEHGFSANTSMEGWRAQVGGTAGTRRVEDGLAPLKNSQAPYKRTVTISILGKGDPAYTERRCYLYRAWPSKLAISSLEGMGNGIIIESMTLQHEGLAWGEPASWMEKVADRFKSAMRQSISDAGDSLDVTGPFRLD